MDIEITLVAVAGGMFSSLTASGSEMRILLSSLAKDYSLFRVKIRDNTTNQIRRGFRLLRNNSCQPCVLGIDKLSLNVPSYGAFECVQQHRHFSTPPIYPFSLKGEKLMPLFPHVLSPWRPIFQYILRTVIDKDFTAEHFTSNSLIVIELLCSKLASDSLSDLVEVVTPDCLAELKENASRLNSQQKEVLRVQPRSRIGIKILDVYFDDISTCKYEMKNEHDFIFV